MKYKNEQEGFSYVDVMIGILIMMVGVLALVGAISANMVRSYDNDKQIIAKQLALSSIESIFSARNISRDDGINSWDDIGNVGSNPVNGIPQGVFLVGWTPIREDYGQDGVAGTADDSCAAATACQQANGTTLSMPEIIGFERRIVITDVSSANSSSILKRKVDVTIRYRINQGSFREETVSTLIGNYGN